MAWKPMRIQLNRPKGRTQKEDPMFRIQMDATKLTPLAVPSPRKRGLVPMLALAGALVLGCTAPAANAQGGRLNTQQLGDALTSYGKNTVNNNGRTYYTVQCGHGQWKSNVTISLSPNGNVIWMAIEPAQMSDRASAAELGGILKKNVEIGPMFFSLDGHWLRLSYPIPNNDMSDAKVKAYLEAVVNTAVDTMPLWDEKTAGGN
jgi:hypothetical protein